MEKGHTAQSWWGRTAAAREHSLWAFPTLAWVQGADHSLTCFPAQTRLDCPHADPEDLGGRKEADTRGHSLHAYQVQNQADESPLLKSGRQLPRGAGRWSRRPRSFSFLIWMLVTRRVRFVDTYQAAHLGFVHACLCDTPKKTPQNGLMT